MNNIDTNNIPNEIEPTKLFALCNKEFGTVTDTLSVTFKTQFKPKVDIGLKETHSLYYGILSSITHEEDPLAMLKEVKALVNANGSTNIKERFNNFVLDLEQGYHD